MSGKGASGVSRLAAGGDGGRGDSEPKAKKQRLTAETKEETEEELYQMAVAMVFGGELYAKLLQYAGEEGIAHLRGDRQWRRAMDDLPIDNMKELKLPVVPRPSDLDLRALRVLLTEPNKSHHTGRDFGWTFNTLGWLVLARSPLTSNKVLEKIVHGGCNQDLFGYILQRKGGVSASILQKILRVDEKCVYHLSISRTQPNLTSDMLSYLLLRSMSKDGSTSQYILEGAARHKNTSELDLMFLSKHTNPMIRATVARNSSAAKYDLLRSLVSDKISSVRAGVAMNMLTPYSDLLTLATDRDPLVRAAVAENKNVGPELLSALSMDSDNDVLNSVRRNPNVDVDELFTMTNVKHRPILASHSKNPETLTSLVGMGSYDSYIARNPSAPQPLLETLAGSEDIATLCGIAGNTSSSKSTLERVHHTGACTIALSKNPNCPSALLEKLVASDEPQAKQFIGKNPSTPKAVLEAMLLEYTSRVDEEETYEVLCALCANQNLPFSAIVKRIRKEMKDGGEVSGVLGEIV